VKKYVSSKRWYLRKSSQDVTNQKTNIDVAAQGLILFARNVCALSRNLGDIFVQFRAGKYGALSHAVMTADTNVELEVLK
jgi:hypothetical protein